MAETEDAYTAFRKAVAELDQECNQNAAKHEAALSKARAAHDVLMTSAQEAFAATTSQAERDRDALIAAARQEFETHLQNMRDRLTKLKLISADDKQPPTSRAAYSDRMALLMAKLSKLAYEKFEHGDSWQHILRDKLKNGGFDLVGAFAAKDTQGYLCSGDAFNALVFRGTTSPNDWVNNTDAKRVIIKGHPRNVRAHRGFLNGYLAVEPQLFNLLAQAPTKPLYLAGHSLGGALAVIASVALPLEKERIQIKEDDIAAVYTFGAPRVGGGDFAEIVKVPHYRVFNPWDIVPAIPPVWSSFQHTGDMRFLAFADRAPMIRKQMLGGMITLGLVRSIWMGLRKQNRTLVDQHDMANYIQRLQSIMEARNR